MGSGADGWRANCGQAFPLISFHGLRVWKRSGLAGLTSLSRPAPRPLPKHLHTPGSNGRYSTIQCRISHSSLTSLLRDWSSFVLVEGYSYVKLLSRWAKWYFLTLLHTSSTASSGLLTWFRLSPAAQTSPHPPSTWSASFPRPRAWFSVWGFQLAHQPRPGTR